VGHTAVDRRRFETTRADHTNTQDEWSSCGPDNPRRVAAGEIAITLTTTCGTRIGAYTGKPAGARAHLLVDDLPAVPTPAHRSRCGQTARRTAAGDRIATGCASGRRPEHHPGTKRVRHQRGSAKSEAGAMAAAPRQRPAADHRSAPSGSAARPRFLATCRAHSPVRRHRRGGMPYRQLGQEEAITS